MGFVKLEHETCEMLHVGLVPGRKPAAASDEGYLLCAAGASALDPERIGSSSICVLQRVVVRLFMCNSSIRFFNLGLQIAVEWLHECSHVVVTRASRAAGWRCDVAKRIVMVVWMLHGLGVGGKPGHETLCFFG